MIFTRSNWFKFRYQSISLCKTTIIECLKYACTGDVPVLSERGKTFVHDPRHCGQSVVKAQVKCALRTRDGRPVIVTSSMQLTQRRASTQLKSTDGVVRMWDETTGEAVALSHKCADMRRVVPELMGVSRAVLDSVIFCHQEESCWPLSESKRLKERFDDIFATTRWSKALSSMADYRKRLLLTSKDLLADLRLFANNRDVAARLRDEYEQARARIAGYRERQRKYERSIAECEQSLAPLRAARESVQQFAFKREALEGEIEGLRRAADRAFEAMANEFSESDEELRGFHSRFDEEIAAKQRLAARAGDELAECSAGVADKQQRLRALSTRQGQVQQKLDDCGRKTRRLREMVAAGGDQGGDNDNEDNDDESIFADFAGFDRSASNQSASNQSGTDSSASESASSTAVTPAMIERLNAHVVSQLQSLKAATSAQQQRHRERDTAMEQSLSKLRSQANAQRVRIQEVERQSNELRLKERHAASKLANVDGQLESVAQAQAEIAEAESMLAAATQTGEREGARQQQVSGECQRVIEDNTLRMGALSREMALLQHQGEKTAKLKLLKADFLRLQDSFQDMLGEARSAASIDGLQFLRAVKAENLATHQQKVAAVERGLRQQATKLKASVHALQQALALSQSDLTRIRDCEVPALERSRQQFEQQLKQLPDIGLGSSSGSGSNSSSSSDSTNLLSASALDALVVSAQQKLSSVRDNCALSKTASKMYAKFESKAASTRKCPVCLRNFDGDRELGDFRALCQKRTARVGSSNSLERGQRQARALEHRVSQLLQLKPVARRVQAEHAQLRGLRARTSELDGEIAQKQAELEEVAAQEMECGHALSRMQAAGVMALMANLARVSAELSAKRSTYLNGKKAFADEYGGRDGQSRGLGDAQREYTQLQAENSRRSKLLMGARRRTSELMDEKSRLQRELWRLEKAAQAAQQLKLEQQRLQEELQQVRSQAAPRLARKKKELEAALQPIAGAIQEQAQERARARQEWRRNEVRAQKRTQVWTTSANQAQHICEDVLILKSEIESARTVSGSGGSGDIFAVIEAETASLQRLRARVSELGAQAASAQKWLLQVQDNRREVELNMQYRAHRQSLQQRERALEALKSEVAALCGSRSAADSGNVALIARQIGELEAAQQASRSQRDQTSGSIASDKRKAVELLGTLKNDVRYADIGERWRRQSIRHETTLMAMEDVARMEALLDASLIEFHAQKMREINGVLRELWQQTYRGRDIDAIEIVAEHKKASAASKRAGKAKSKSSKRAYNYKVVMTQGEVRLPMRGRCSAGQRVLASLVIRLALAETFCLNCGVLALDEPTTNLDHKNIRALAFALSEIITRRKQQQNFQLILITHDEEFVEMLGQRAHADGYYRVYKDDAQHSKVKLYKFHNNSNGNSNSSQSQQAQNQSQNNNNSNQSGAQRASGSGSNSNALSQLSQ